MISCVVERTPDEILWRDFGTQNDYSPEIHFDKFGSHFVYRFDPTQYHGALDGHYQVAKNGG